MKSPISDKSQMGYRDRPSSFGKQILAAACTKKEKKKRIWAYPINHSVFQTVDF